MAIVEQYGMRITDRVTIVSDVAAGTYIVKFDGEKIGEAHSGPHGVRLAQRWLSERQARREAEARRAAEAEKHAQDQADVRFIVNVAAGLGVSEEDLEGLLAIAVRRALKEFRS